MNHLHHPPNGSETLSNIIANMAKYVIEVLLPPAVRERQGNRRGISEPALGSPPGWTCLGQHPRKLAHVDMDELLY